MEYSHKFIPKLCNEITQKRDIIANNLVYQARQEDIVDKIEDANQLFSWLVEHPEIREKLLLSQKPANLRREIKRGVNRIKNGWTYLLENTENIGDEINHDILRKVGKAVDKRNNNYRTHRVTLDFSGSTGGDNFTPPAPESVERRLDEFFAYLHKNGMNPIEKAAYTHLMLAGIQPFQDGNKRTTRLIQTKMLYEHNLPPAVIPPGEREHYLGVLRQALANSKLGGCDEDDVEKMKPFFTYIAGKVNTALDNIIGDIDPKLYKEK